MALVLGIKDSCTNFIMAGCCDKFDSSCWSLIKKSKVSSCHRRRMYFTKMATEEASFVGSVLLCDETIAINASAISVDRAFPFKKVVL